MVAEIISQSFHISPGGFGRGEPKGHQRTGRIIDKDDQRAAWPPCFEPVMRRAINLDQLPIAWAALPPLINTGNLATTLSPQSLLNHPLTQCLSGQRQPVNFPQLLAGPKSGYLSLTSEITSERNSGEKALLGRFPRRRETSP